MKNLLFWIMLALIFTLAGICLVQYGEVAKLKSVRRNVEFETSLGFALAKVVGDNNKAIKAKAIEEQRLEISRYKENLKRLMVILGDLRDGSIVSSDGKVLMFEKIKVFYGDYASGNVIELAMKGKSYDGVYGLWYITNMNGKWIASDERAAQQVDAAEPSTNAVPPSMPSGLAR